jgi:hypothetical protein
MSDLDKAKQEVMSYVNTRLGGDIIDIELDPKHYEESLSTALNVYKQRSQNAYEESYMFLHLEDGVQEYTLPPEVQTIRTICRRTIGTSGQNGGTAGQFEPFEAGYMNSYLLQAGRTAGQSGGLLNYELFAGYQELTARMFGGYINFHWNPSTHRLTIVRNPHGTGEVVLLHVFNYKPDITILQNPQSSQWVKDYALAVAKTIIGQARGKFGTVAGPQGGTTLNGAEMKQEGAAEIEKLLEDLKNYIDGSQPLSFIFG